MDGATAGDPPSRPYEALLYADYARFVSQSSGQLRKVVVVAVAVYAVCGLTILEPRLK